MNVNKKTLTIDGMHCNACAMLIRETLEDAGAENIAITIDQEKNVGTVTLATDLPDNKLKELIENEGEYTLR